MKLKKLLEFVIPGEDLDVYDYAGNHICHLNTDGRELNERYECYINICYFKLIEYQILKFGAIRDCIIVYLKEVING